MFTGEDFHWWRLPGEGFLGVGSEGLPVCLPELDEGAGVRAFYDLTLEGDQDGPVVQPQSCRHFPGGPHEGDLADQRDVGKAGCCYYDPGWSVFIENSEARVLDFSSQLTSTIVLRECRILQLVVGIDVPEDQDVLEL